LLRVAGRSLRADEHWRVRKEKFARLCRELPAVVASKGQEKGKVSTGHGLDGNGRRLSKTPTPEKVSHRVIDSQVR
jgi:hypothetical protein